jgi:monoamine oxidase
MHEADVVIIGAGAAGVAAASRLAATPLGVLVLEARDRSGFSSRPGRLTAGLRRS